MLYENKNLGCSANPYLRNKRPSKKMQPAAVAAVPPAFWDNHMEWKNNYRGGKTCFMELCFMTPLGFFKERDRKSHMDGLAALSNNPQSPVIKHNWLELCLYDDVARAFKNIMMSPIVVKGYKYGWFPVIAMKNALIQRAPHFAVNTPAIGIALLSNFWRMCVFLSQFAFLQATTAFV